LWLRMLRRPWIPSTRVAMAKAVLLARLAISAAFPSTRRRTSLPARAACWPSTTSSLSTVPRSSGRRVRIARSSSVARSTNMGGWIPARLSGRSGYTFAKLVQLWVNGFTAFSIKPLRVATWLGFLFAIAGFALGVWVVVDKVLHPEIQAGYSSLMAALLFTGGILMLMLGLVGEYVGRIYLCINSAPQYVIRRSTRPDDAISGTSRT